VHDSGKETVSRGSGGSLTDKAQRPRKKLPYERPRIVHSEPIDAHAGTCDGTGGTKNASIPCAVTPFYS
jgi:hypothetical protein